jgi:hypothetical protein
VGLQEKLANCIVSVSVIRNLLSFAENGSFKNKCTSQKPCIVIQKIKSHTSVDKKIVKVKKLQWATECDFTKL